MGMFDYIRCNIPLPDTGKVSPEEFQTKDLREFMERYEIREDGTLWRFEVEREWKDDDQHFLGGYLGEVEGSQRWLPVSDVHQDVTFYGEWKDNKLREYTARFTDGQLTRLTYKDITGYSLTFEYS